MKSFCNRLFAVILLSCFLSFHAKAKVKALDFSDEKAGFPMVFFESDDLQELLKLAKTFKEWKERDLNAQVIGNGIRDHLVFPIVKLKNLTNPLKDEKKWEKLKQLEALLKGVNSESSPQRNIDRVKLISHILGQMNGEVFNANINTGEMISLDIPVENSFSQDDQNPLYYIYLRPLFPAGLEKLYDLKVQTLGQKNSSESQGQNLRHLPSVATGVLYMSGLSHSLGHLSIEGDLFSRFLFSLGSLLMRVESSTVQAGDLYITYSISESMKVSGVPSAYLEHIKPTHVSIFITNDLIFAPSETNESHRRWIFRPPYCEDMNSYATYFRPASGSLIKTRIDEALRKLDEQNGNHLAFKSMMDLFKIEVEMNRDYLDKERIVVNQDLIQTHLNKINPFIGILDQVMTYYKSLLINNKEMNEIVTLLQLRIDVARSAILRMKYEYEELIQGPSKP